LTNIVANFHGGEKGGYLMAGHCKRMRCDLAERARITRGAAERMRIVGA